VVTINTFAVRKSIAAADINKKARLVLALAPFIVFAVLIVYFVAQ